MAEAIRKTSEAQSIVERIEALDWKSAGESLSQRGYAVTAQVLSSAECASLVALYKDAEPVPQRNHHGALSLRHW